MQLPARLWAGRLRGTKTLEPVCLLLPSWLAAWVLAGWQTERRVQHWLLERAGPWLAAQMLAGWQTERRAVQGAQARGQGKQRRIQQQQWQATASLVAGPHQQQELEVAQHQHQLRQVATCLAAEMQRLQAHSVVAAQ